mmetsp:Transcript_4250/g.27134  ORF Transcript_4250/g.27134 Transcript_4250/m.27134 type:complete len:107 (-) Transcript_4250:965-1285(-)
MSYNVLPVASVGMQRDRGVRYRSGTEDERSPLRCVEEEGTNPSTRMGGRTAGKYRRMGVHGNTLVRTCACCPALLQEERNEQDLVSTTKYLQGANAKPSLLVLGAS